MHKFDGRPHWVPCRISIYSDPIGCALARITAVGATPKYETGQTWGVGPKAEIGRKASKDANTALVKLYNELEDQLPHDLQGKAKGYIIKTKNDRTIQNALFRAMFRDKVGQGRVVVRRY